ncbi:hypothetical protein ACN27G_27465 [Plantactinospora sp. WMMB334]|uniref:hypothetical protein n=1 Tax=Plantactinospora sp. WMMB334 TaxID=3404119 RepID=UPI003B952B67
MTTVIMERQAAVGASVPAVAAGPTHLIRASSTNPGNILVSRAERGGTINHLFPVVEVHEFTDRTGYRIALVVCRNGTFAFSQSNVIEIAGPRPARRQRVKR